RSTSTEPGRSTSTDTRFCRSTPPRCSPRSPGDFLWDVHSGCAGSSVTGYGSTVSAPEMTRSMCPRLQSDYISLVFREKGCCLMCPYFYEDQFFHQLA